MQSMDTLLIIPEERRRASSTDTIPWDMDRVELLRIDSHRPHIMDTDRTLNLHDDSHSLRT